MQKNKLYIVPDEHCRGLYKPLLSVKDTPIVFLGDYMDPYSYEGHTDEEGIENLKEIFEFARTNNNVTLLAGNHDLSHLFSFMGYERTSHKYYNELHKLYRDNVDLLHPYHIIDDLLFTHAGISNAWIYRVNDVCFYNSDFKVTPDNVLDYIGNEWENELKEEFAITRFGYGYLKSPIFWCGYDRGGDDPAGGPFWRDCYSDFDISDFKYKQIFGHSQGEETGCIREFNVGTCLDSRAIFEYDFETKVISKANLL